jgi:glycogen operon protein
MKASTPDHKGQQKMTQRYATSPGRFHPLGAIPDRGGVNFAVFCRNATGVQLLLFDRADAKEPAQVIDLDPALNTTYFIWHVYVKGLRPGAHYAYRVDGPQDLHGAGYRYNKNKVLIDPYARGNTKALWKRDDATGPGDNLATSMRSVVIDTGGYDWEGDRPLNRPPQDAIVYEMHVGGFTRHGSSGVKDPGTFAGVAEKVPYLRELGVTAVELMPVMSFDANQVMRLGPDGKPLRNYWGYSTVGFFAPEDSYCVAPQLGRQITEFRDMVKALHRAGIEVILDVVFNHTDEGNENGPTFLLQGLRERGLLLPPPRRPAVLHGLHRLRQHPALQQPDHHALHPRLSDLLGAGAARGRLPLRPRQHSDPRRERRDPEPAAHRLRHQPPGAPGRYQDDRRGVGPGPVPGR